MHTPVTAFPQVRALKWGPDPTVCAQRLPSRVHRASAGRPRHRRGCPQAGAEPVDNALPAAAPGDVRSSSLVLSAAVPVALSAAGPSVTPVTSVATMTSPARPSGGRVSIAEQDQRGVPEPPLDDWGDGRRPTSPGERPTRPGDRTPPQDNAAEQSVLGAMLLSKDAIADVAETVRGVDFYRPAHEVIHDAIIDLYGRGEPADPVTVAAELQRRGELLRIGGAPYLHTLSANVPIAANAGYYAEIVHEKAILRRLVDAGTKIVQLGYAGEGQVDDVVDQAQAEVYKITDKRTSRGLRPALRHHGRRPRRDRGDRQPRGRPLRRAHRVRRPRRPDQRPARRPDDHRRRPAGDGQGAGARHTAADAIGLDDDGRGPRRRPACTTPHGRPTRVVAATEVHARPALLRGRVLRRLDASSPTPSTSG